MMNNIKYILIIEDNPEDQMVYQRYLSRSFSQPLDIVIKDNGRSALTFLLNNTVDCVLLDYQLPDMSGLDLLRKILEQLKTIPPIIMLTGQGSETVAVEALKLGAYDYLTKSTLRPELLHKAIANAVEKSVLMKKVKKQESKIKHMAYHDYLTGIPNRLQFEQIASQALARAKRYQKKLAILMMDLDQFKIVNDTLGHGAGDLLLKQVVKRFEVILREDDTLARLGGDEFALVAEEINESEQASMVAQRLMQSLKEPFFLNHHETHITISIGIAIYPDAGEDISELMRNADLALYRAKEMGKNNFQYFER